VSLLLTYYYIKQCLTYHLDRTRQWSKLETLVSKWSTLYGTPFLSSEVTVLCWCLHMTLYTPVTISNFIDHCHNYVFACLNKKSKIDQEFANCCEISLSIWFFLFFVTIFVLSVVVWLLDFHYLCNQCLSPLSCEIEPHSWRGVLDTTLCDKVCQWLAAGRWFSLGTPVSFTNKMVRHDITEAFCWVCR
jgi:hypothetical protein